MISRRRSRARFRIGVSASAVFVLGFLAEAVRADSPPERPNVVVLLVDTARADHFSTYGYELETTPHFGVLAQDAILFQRAYSTSCWTVPSHASLFTGLYPMTHGATQELQHLDDELTTLAELLLGAGYQTFSISGNPWVSERTNLVQGFERSKVVNARRRAGGTAQDTGLPHPSNRKVAEWLDARDRSRPFFLFVNYIEPHWPYAAPRAYQQRFLPAGVELEKGDKALFSIVRWYMKRDLVDPELIPLRTASYDAELAYADALVNDLVGELAQRDLLDGSLVIVTSDHGESHGDHGHVGHSFNLYDCVVRIPLLVKPPAWRAGARVRTDPVQIHDLFPTVLAATGVPRPASDAGVADDARDLLAGTVPEDRPVIAEYYYPNQVLGFLPDGADQHTAIQPHLRRIRSIRVGDDKLIWGSDGRHELYDLRRDPQEQDDRFDGGEDTARALEAQLAAFVELRAREVTAEALDDLDEETRERLRSLGYLR